MEREAPQAYGQAAQNKGALRGAAGDSGWKIKPDKIKGEACRKDSDRAQPPGVRAAWGVAGGGKELEAASRSLEAKTQLLQSKRPAAPLPPKRSHEEGVWARPRGHGTPGTLCVHNGTQVEAGISGRLGEVPGSALDQRSGLRPGAGRSLSQHHRLAPVGGTFLQQKPRCRVCVCVCVCVEMEKK